tara:strand:- start:276 stop:569 length:294 start_codon:yes stop_codon:yes gene_type:complete
MSTSTAWSLTAYTPDTWTPLVQVPADVTSIIVTNTDLLNDKLLQVRLGTAEIAGAQLVPAGDALKLDIKALPVSAASQLQIKADAAGLHFTAAGLSQ